ncbi:hypothetical protein PVK06_027465 [Gossypium arboreum]|uniref:Reverse transcriptase zinc-binding domain-containing protein n=1 Tax=Gossypium arboreum TaxID=29729 RepID=A0ABR0P2X3_GOSAR|nr:hypothetical protein PVK06_027465 [Gossypium arboreum]
MNPYKENIIWRCERTGEYSVPNRHKFFLQDGQTQRQQSYRIFYKKLWNLDLPPKIKITNRRIFFNYLPTFINQHYRRMLGSVTCQRCQYGTKNREHLFRECPTSKETWEKLNVTWPVADANIEYKYWIKNIFDSNSFFKCRLIACVMWVIWMARTSLFTRVSKKQVLN